MQFLWSEDVKAADIYCRMAVQHGDWCMIQKEIFAISTSACHCNTHSTKPTLYSFSLSYSHFDVQIGQKICHPTGTSRLGFRTYRTLRELFFFYQALEWDRKDIPKSHIFTTILRHNPKQLQQKFRCCYNYLLTPWSRVLLEKLTGSAPSQEIPPLYGTRRFLTVPTSAQHLFLSSANSIQSPQPPLTS